MLLLSPEHLPKPACFQAADKSTTSGNSRQNEQRREWLECNPHSQPAELLRACVQGLAVEYYSDTASPHALCWVASGLSPGSDIEARSIRKSPLPRTTTLLRDKWKSHRMECGNVTNVELQVLASLLGPSNRKLGRMQASSQVIMLSIAIGCFESPCRSLTGEEDPHQRASGGANAGLHLRT